MPITSLQERFFFLELNRKYFNKSTAHRFSLTAWAVSLTMSTSQRIPNTIENKVN